MVNLNASFLSQEALQNLGFSSLGVNVLVHHTAVLVGCHAISLKDNVRIDPFCVLSASGGITIGRNVHIASHCSLTGSSLIEIGDFCGLSHGVHVFSANDDYSGAALTGPTVPIEYRNVCSAPVRIGNHTVVGSNSVVLPGCVIGEGVAVGAQSLVKADLEAWTIYAGTPARPIRARSRDLLTLERDYLAKDAGENCQ